MSTPYGTGPDRPGPTGAPTPALIGSGWAPSAPPAAPRGADPAPQAVREQRPAADEPARTPEPRPQAPREAPDSTPTTVLPGASPGTASVRRPGGARPAPARPAPARSTPRPADTRGGTKSRRARLALQRIDPWSVFTYTLVASVFLGIALVVAAFVLYTVLGALGVPDTVNELYTELTDEPDALLTSGRVLSAAAVLAAVNVVLLTLLATLGALLYNLCASFTGGIEVTLGERDG